MNPLLIIGVIAAAGYALLSGKKPTTGTTSGTTIKVPSQSTTISVPGGTITVPTPAATSTSTGTTITVPQVTVTPATPAASAAPSVEVPTPPTAAEQAKDGTALSYDEHVSIESDLPSDLYNKAMASQHMAYVVAAAARLASLGDVRAADLTLRIANWGH
jgi:hypothetical protein